MMGLSCNAVVGTRQSSFQWVDLGKHRFGSAITPDNPVIPSRQRDRPQGFTWLLALNYPPSVLDVRGTSVFEF